MSSMAYSNRMMYGYEKYFENHTLIDGLRDGTIQPRFTTMGFVYDRVENGVQTDLYGNVVKDDTLDKSHE